MNNISSWGNIPKYQHKNIFSISDSSVFHENKLTFLSHGLGRSYGDVCLNENLIKTNGEIPALGVLKNFGNIKSKGMLSFPRDGITMALDFPNKSGETLKFFNKLDKIIMEYGGALYPAKDARMSKEVFETSFPKFDLFSQYIDPRFSSSFYRRIK